MTIVEQPDDDLCEAYQGFKRLVEAGFTEKQAEVIIQSKLQLISIIDSIHEGNKYR